jgi:hypothetical protein
VIQHFPDPQRAETHESLRAPQTTRKESSEYSVVEISSNAPETTPLEVYETAILKERQGNLSEAVLNYRKALKVPTSKSQLILDGSRCR